MLEPEMGSERVWSVSDLTREVKGCLEVNFGAIWVRGEISNLFEQPSGHRYFTLKDADCQLRAVLFRGDAIRMETLPVDGEQFVVYGDVSVYEPRGEYQLRVRHLLADGAGGLRREFERLKRKLAEEGLFDPELKRPLPELPRRVAIITSAAGAAFQDFVSILQRRHWRGEVLLFPSKVQGAEAPGEILEALHAAERYLGVDLLVVGRGGGSAEDLWAFNEENLVRAVAACPLPVISAVGHQIDFVLTDFAADFRAETPSAAAERISSDFIKQGERLRDIGAMLKDRVSIRLERLHGGLKLSEARLRSSSPKALVETAHQRLDDVSDRLRVSVRERLGNLSLRLENLAQRLEGNSLTGTLKRGFSMIRDKDGKPVARKAELKLEQSVKATFADGEASLRVES